jgi:hypothetical protein
VKQVCTAPTPSKIYGAKLAEPTTNKRTPEGEEADPETERILETLVPEVSEPGEDVHEEEKVVTVKCYGKVNNTPEKYISLNRG